MSTKTGFRLAPHSYYRDAVDALGYEIKPCRYELELECCETDCAALTGYLREHLSPGEAVELWSVWVGSGAGRVRRYRGTLAEFDLETLGTLLEIQYDPDWEAAGALSLFSQVCLTILI